MKWLLIVLMLVAVVQVFEARVANDYSQKHVVKLREDSRFFVDNRRTLLNSKTAVNETFAEIAKRSGIDGRQILSIVDAAKPHLNLNRIRPGMRYDIRDYKEAKQVRLALSQSETLLVAEQGDGTWQSRIEKRTLSTKIVEFKGAVESSLWGAGLEAQMTGPLIVDFAEIFAWQVDFAREVQRGDSFRLAVEERWDGPRRLGYGRIIAAEYIRGSETYQAVYFDSETQPGYFQPDGKSLKKMFLKSPIKFGRISSRFNYRRMHPILKKVRPHLGVDYAAPRGTPIRAVGDGRIERIGRYGGAGKMIKIRHNLAYKTAYKHLSRFKKGLKKGSKVVQGDIIGYVGSTGMSTAPHLHYEFYHKGRYVDPLGVKFPSAKPVQETLITEFKAQAEKKLLLLPQKKEDDQKRVALSEDKKSVL